MGMATQNPSTQFHKIKESKMNDSIIKAEDLMNLVKNNNSESVDASGENPESIIEENTEFGVPLGDYDGEVTGVRIWTHRVHNHDVVRIDTALHGGEYAGHVVTKYFNLRTKEAGQCFRREMAGLGITVKLRPDVFQVPSQLVGMSIGVEIAANNKGNNVVHLLKAKPKPVVPQFDPNSIWI